MKQGFSIRPNSFGSGTRLSYGLILHNESGVRDALNINVQVNFVMADDHLLGTDNQHVDGIAAGSDWALGNSVSFPGAAPIVRLEIVILVGSFQAQAIHVPTLANIHLVPQLFDPKWVGTIEGEPAAITVPCGIPSVRPAFVCGLKFWFASLKVCRK